MHFHSVSEQIGNYIQSEDPLRERNGRVDPSYPLFSFHVLNWRTSILKEEEKETHHLKKVGAGKRLNTLKGMITFESTKGWAGDTLKSLKSQIRSINHPRGLRWDSKVRRIRRNIIAIEVAVLFIVFLFSSYRQGTLLSPIPAPVTEGFLAN